MGRRQWSGFKLVEVDGYKERELYETEEIDDMAEFLAEKGGLEIPDLWRDK